MTKRIDPDILAIKQCFKVLNNSTSAKMLRANLEFINGHFAAYPNPKPVAKKKKQH